MPIPSLPYLHQSEALHGILTADPSATISDSHLPEHPSFASQSAAHLGVAAGYGMDRPQRYRYTADPFCQLVCSDASRHDAPARSPQH